MHREREHEEMETEWSFPLLAHLLSANAASAAAAAATVEVTSW